MHKTRLQDMTSREFAQRAAEKPVVLIPFGAQETQGPHIPMGDFVLAEALAARVAARTDCVVAPTLPFGNSEFYRSLPGCVSLRPDTFVSVVADICENFLDHGLDRLVIFNGQTSNAPLIDQAVRHLRRKWGVYIPCINIWRILTPAQMQMIYGDQLAGSQGHGGDPITSMFLHLFPDLARMDLLEAPKAFKKAMGLQTRSISSLDFQGVAVQMPLDMAQMSESGNLSGNGALSSPEIGAKVADAIIAFSAAFVDHFRTCDPRSLD